MPGPVPISSKFGTFSVKFKFGCFCIGPLQKIISAVQRATLVLQPGRADLTAIRNEGQTTKKKSVKAFI